MRTQHLTLMRLGAVSFALLLLSVTMVSPAAAVDKPAITVAVVWRPGTQLVTDDPNVNHIWDDFESDGNYYGPDDDDFRYVEAEIYVTTSVPFWAVDLTCTVNPDVLEGYSNVDTSGSPVDDHDDQPMLVWGSEWDARGGPNEAGTSGVYDPATGSMDLTATLVGSWNDPLGSYGYTDTFLLATLRYRTAPIDIPDDSDIKCTGRFLNRDGEDVVKPKFDKAASLDVLLGYTISGTVTYQALPKIPKGNEPWALCVWDLGGPDEIGYGTPVDSKGLWSITARRRGHYDCFFVGTIPSPGGATMDLHLVAREAANLGPDQYSEWFTDFHFLPVELRAGNVEITPNVGCDSDWRGGAGQDIDTLDLGAVTSSYEINALGDVNGDGWTNEEDLAVVGYNYGSCEDYYHYHVLYDLPRDVDAYQNSRIWLGAQWSGQVTQLIPGPKEGRDLWATLSPDGSQVAFIRSSYDKKSGTTRYGLYLSPLDKPKATAILPKGFAYDAFAPSWSPDGQRIAFVCSWDYYTSSTSDGYQTNDGLLCLIDANGDNFQLLDAQAGGVPSSIWPPSWYGNNELVFSHDGIGVSQIYRYYLDLGGWDFFDTIDPGVGNDNDIPDGSDMPIIHNGALYYRYTNGGGKSVLRWAAIDCSRGPCYVNDYAFPLGPWTGPEIHTDVTYWDTGMSKYVDISEDVDYYELEPWGDAIIFNETGGWAFYTLWVTAWNLDAGLGRYWPEWIDPAGKEYTVFGQYGNPTCFFGPPCDLFALRNTIDGAQGP
jgi:hypothetical protein